jgi:hypothetical protein
MLIYTAPGGIATPFTQNLPFLPENLYWDDAAAPLTNLRISTKKDGVIHDWTAAAIAAMNGYMLQGPIVANDNHMKICSGHLEGPITLSGVTSAAGAINFYSRSDNKGGGMAPVPFKSEIYTTVALTPVIFQNFVALFIPTMATLTDYADVEFEDGHKERMELEDLFAMSLEYQTRQLCIINNITSYIHRVSLRTAAATPVYILKFCIPGQ